MSELCLRDVRELEIQTAIEVIARIVLDNTKRILAVNVAWAGCIIDGLDRYVNVIFEQRVAVGRFELCPDVLVILDALKDDLSGLGIPCYRMQRSSFGFLIRVAGDIPDALISVQRSDNVITVSLVLCLEENVIEHRLFCLTIAKGLGNVNRVCIDMAVIDERVKILIVRALPSQNNIVLVAVVAVNKAFVTVELCIIANTERVVAVTCVQSAVGVIRSCIGCVDLFETGRCHGNRHGVGLIAVFGFCNCEFVVSFRPLCNRLRASCILEEFERYFTIVGKTTCKNILKGIIADIGGRRCDRRQCADDLVFYGVTCGCRCIVCKAVGNGIGSIVVTGIGLCLTDCFFERHDTRFIFRVQSYVVQPVMATVRNVVVRVAVGHTTVNIRHRQGHEARIGRTHDHFRNLGFNEQIEAERQVICLGLTILSGLRHFCTAVCCDIRLKRVLNCRSIRRKGIFQRCAELIRLVIPFAGIKRIVGVFIAFCTVCKADSCEHIRTGSLVDCVQNLNMVVLLLIFCRLRELHNVGNFEVSVFHTLNCIAVGLQTVAEIRRCVTVLTRCRAERIIDALVVLTGGNIAAFVPHAILGCIRKIILIQREVGRP